MEKIQAIELMEQMIINKDTHKDYLHTVELADKYRRIITGDEIEKQLIQFVQRENKELFDQRVRLTSSITPSVFNTIKMPFYKVARNNKVLKQIDIADDAKKTNVAKMMLTFFGSPRKKNKGLEYFLSTRFVDYTFTDPNAWVVIEWEAVEKTKVPTPLPFVVHAREAVNFSIKNDVVKYLLVRNDIKYKEKTDVIDAKGKKTETLADGFKYTLYDEDVTIVYEQVSKKYLEESGYQLQQNETLVTLEDKNDFLQRTFNPQIGFVPASRIGYARDLSTNGRTFVSPIQPAMPYFDKLVERISELDLTMKLHTFPQKFQYVNKCSGESKTKKCNRGFVSTGETCKVCDGKGYKVHTSAQDIVLLPMPSDPKELFDLNGLMAYKAPPIDIVKIQMEYTKELKEDAIKAIYNSDTFLQSSIVKTATEKDYDMESVYDTLFPFTEKVSEVWVDIVSIFSKLALVDIEDESVKILHSFPSDLKLKTMSMLLAELQAVNDSQAPSFVRDSINGDIADQMYGDNQIELEKYQVKQRFFPFNGKSMEEITLAVSSTYIPEFDKVLYFNFEKIFAELEKDKPNFFVLPFNKQWDLVGEKVNAIMNDIQEAAADRFSLGIDLTGANATVKDKGQQGAAVGGNAGAGAATNDKTETPETE